MNHAPLLKGRWYTVINFFLLKEKIQIDKKTISQGWGIQNGLFQKLFAIIKQEAIISGIESTIKASDTHILEMHKS